MKLAISCDTWVRASPVSCAAAGSCVSWLSVSRAAVRCRFTLSVSGCVCAVDGAAGSCDEVADGVVAPAAFCAGVLAAAAGSAAAGSGRGLVFDDAVEGDEGVDGDEGDEAAVGVGSAGVAAACAAPGSCVAAGSVGVAALPLLLIAAANAVTCVRTSCSFARAASSSVADASLLPAAVDAPVVPTGAAPVALSPPSRSFRMRSIAATSVPQLVAVLAAGLSADAP